MDATPVTWRVLIEAGWKGTPGLRVFCTGEALAADLAGELVERSPEVWNLYGPTETTIWSAIHRIRSGAPPILIGRPVANTEMYILDRRFQPVPTGVSGELYIGGHGLARGYLNRPDLTVEKFIEHPFQPGARVYRTGDLARYRSDGSIECQGRIDHQVKIRGFRIELGEIEAALKEHEAVKQAVVVAREDTPGDKRLVAYVAPSNEHTPDRAELRDRLRQRLPDYMVPAYYVILPEIPLSPNGKIDRRRLPPPDHEAVAEAAKEYVAPRTPVEESVHDIWVQLLRRDRIGVFDNFFDLGGHSLSAMQVVARIHRAFGVEVPLSRLFENPTIEGTALAVNEIRASACDEDDLARLLAEVEGSPEGDARG
jgi:acyl-coenzyme A synthetase/AMP-(fatty) acid ligase/acyl carrier protein